LVGKKFPQNGPQICNVSGLKSAIWAGVYIIKHKTWGLFNVSQCCAATRVNIQLDLFVTMGKGEHPKILEKIWDDGIGVKLGWRHCIQAT
jgi:hypothetical protein